MDEDKPSKFPFIITVSLFLLFSKSYHSDKLNAFLKMPIYAEKIIIQTHGYACTHENF